MSDILSQLEINDPENNGQIKDTINVEKEVDCSKENESRIEVLEAQGSQSPNNVAITNNLELRSAASTEPCSLAGNENHKEVEQNTEETSRSNDELEIDASDKDSDTVKESASITKCYQEEPENVVEKSESVIESINESKEKCNDPNPEEKENVEKSDSKNENGNETIEQEEVDKMNMEQDGSEKIVLEPSKDTTIENEVEKRVALESEIGINVPEPCDNNEGGAIEEKDDNEDDDIDDDESDHEGEVEDLIIQESDDCESNNEFIIADEKTTDLLSDSEARHKKRRRRIFVGESDDTDSEIEREEILRSCTPDHNNSNESNVSDSEQESKNNDSAEEIIDPEDSELIAKEKPGPKSKKSSTYLMMEQKIEARQLLKTAIIIPADKKKRVKRVLDSDDESCDEKDQEADLYGIGQPDEECTTDSLTGNNILLSENISVDPNFVPLEGVEMDKIGEVVPIENPIIPVEEENKIPTTEPVTVDLNTKTENTLKQEVLENDQNPTAAQDLALITDTLKQPLHGEPVALSVCPVSANVSYVESPTTVITDLTDDNNLQKIIKKEPQLDQATSEKFLADALRSQFSNEAPASIKALESKTELGNTNTTFWGRESSSSDEEDDEWNNDFFTGSKNSSKKPSFYNKHYNRSMSHSSNKRKFQTRRDSSTSSDERNRRKRKAAATKSQKTIFLTRNQQVPLRTGIQARSKKDIKKKVKDRFFDRSLLVPNDIYFGDTQVPLHVLHSYNSDAVSSSSDSESGWFSQMNKPKVIPARPMYKVVPKNKPSANTFHSAKASTTSSSNTAVSPHNDAMIQTMKNYLKAAGVRKVKYNKIWEGCKSNSERANAMLRLLRDKGLVGEPTMAKCRAIKMKLQAKKEIAELDTSLILDNDSEDEGIKTRRSRRAIGRKNYNEQEEPVVPPETVQTLTKLKQVIDSDSD